MALDVFFFRIFRQEKTSKDYFGRPSERVLSEEVEVYRNALTSKDTNKKSGASTLKTKAAARTFYDEQYCFWG